MKPYTTSLALLAAGLTIGVAVTAVVFLYDSTESDPNRDAISARAPEKTMLVRLMAPDDGCWTRTIRDELNVEDEVTEGCGPVTLPVRFRKDIDISFERRPPASWTWCLVAAVDGQIVLTRGPDSNPDYSLDAQWPPKFGGNSPIVEVAPVACAEG